MNSYLLIAAGVVLGLIVVGVVGGVAAGLERFAQWMADGLNEPWDDDNNGYGV